MSHALIAGIGYFKAAKYIFWRLFLIGIYRKFIFRSGFLSRLFGFSFREPKSKN
jgi:hypothetical protein